jgi:hypothetical protein
MATAKAISLFAPLSTKSVAECDDHYQNVHTVWGRRMLRDTGAVLSYHTARARSKYDVNGRFRQQPSRWRYTMLRLDPGLLRGFGADTDELIANDHLNFLQDFRGFSVAEEVLVDRRNGQSGFEAYLFEFDRRSGVTEADGALAVDGLREGLRSAARDGYGLRTVALDAVLAETAAEAMEQPAQRPLRRPLPSTDKLAFVEFLFDQHEWAEEWFGGGAFRDLLTDPRFATVIGHHIDLRAGFDDR